MQYSPNTKKYKCDIKIHNINLKPEKRRIFSYDKTSNKSYKTRNSNGTKIFISDHSKAYDNYDLEYELRRNKSFDGKKLKMQNSQNMQILQEEKLYQLLVPLYPNEIQKENEFQIISKSTEINNFDKITEIKKNIIINEKETKEKIINQNEIFNKSIKIFKKQIWTKQNSPNRKKRLSILSMDSNNDNKNKKFEGEMKTEKFEIYLERVPRNWNTQLQNKRGEPLSIEREKKKEKILEEKSVDSKKIQNKNLKISNENKENKIEIKGIDKSWKNKISIVKVEKNLNFNSNNLNIKYKLEKEIKKDESENSSEYDILKSIQSNNEENNNKYREEIIQSFKSNGINRKVIINETHIYIPKTIETYRDNNESKISQSLYTKKIIIKSPQENNQDSESPPQDKVVDYPKAEQEINEENKNVGNNFIFQHSYRESKIKEIIKKEENKENGENNIINKNIDNNKLKEKNRIEDEPIDSNLISEKNTINEDSLSNDYSTPSRKIKTHYREEILILSPKYKDKDEIISNEKNDKKESFNCMEEEYQKYMNLEKNQTHISDLNEANNIEEEMIPIENNNDNGKNNNIDNNYNNKNHNTESDFGVNFQEEDKSYISLTEENLRIDKINKSQIIQNSDILNEIKNNNKNNNKETVKIMSITKIEKAKKIPNSKTQDICHPLNCSNRLNTISNENIKNHETKTALVNFGNKNQINIGNIVINLNRKKNNVKIKKKEEKNQEEKNEEDILIFQTKIKNKNLNSDNKNINNNEDKNNDDNTDYNDKSNKVRILKK